MSNQRRSALTSRPQLENLDARIVPSAVAMMHSEPAAAVQHLAAGHHHAHVKAVHMAHQVVRTHHTHSKVSHFAYSGNANALISTTVPRATEAVTLSAAVKRAATTSQTPVVTGPFAPASVVSHPVTPASTTTTGTATSPNTGATTTTSTGSTGGSTTTQPNDTVTGGGDPLQKGGSDLVALYQAYQAYVDGGSKGTFSPPQAAYIEIVGNSVNVDIQGTGDLSSFEAALTSLGMQIQATDANTGTIEGLLPIAQLENVAQLSQTVDLHPVYLPHLA